MHASEVIQVLSAITSLDQEGERSALATIVSARGSTYRRPGARLLVSETGKLVGNLSGGCLEGEVEQLARKVMDEGTPRLALYDLTADDEVVWGWGLGCNGAIEVFIEPAGKAAGVADALRMAIEEQRRLAVATVVESTVSGTERGARLLVDLEDRREGSLGSPGADDAVAELTRAALSSGRTETVSLTVQGGELRLFVEVLEPPLRLLVCGAGHDAVPLVHLASEMGWRVRVTDDRPALLERDRFPEGVELLLAGPGEQGAAGDTVDEGTYAVVMSHNYLRDRDYLRALLPTSVAYIGMLGPRARLERLLAELDRDGVKPSSEDMAKVHGPAGLDLGAETPEEVAVAIVSEILASSRSRAGGQLKDRRAPIHDAHHPAEVG